MRTVPRNWPKRMPRGDFIVRCFYCNDPVPKSQTTVDYDGRIRCSREPPGTAREADAANAAWARRHRQWL